MQKFSTEYARHVHLIRRVASASVFLLSGLFMAQRLDVAYQRELLARWCNLAEQRLQHLTELFETGRWSRYHSEQAFLENILEARSAVEVWRSLSMPETSGDNEVVRGNWAAAAPSQPAVAASPAHASVTPPRGGAQRDPVQPAASLPLPFSSAPRLSRLPVAPAVRIVASNATPVPVTEAPAVKRNPLPDPDDAQLDIAAMQRRYPLLRNAM